ncbi:hypothetical protein WJX72_003015 [[Myrmecia] bisecta]|uniref:Uncharacterized protein n=1 Tax=[Myrmecia] bisecta TaxID=41462 RepID=A0AAW1PL19_9CHLO
MLCVGRDPGHDALYSQPRSGHYAASFSRSWKSRDLSPDTPLAVSFEAPQQQPSPNSTVAAEESRETTTYFSTLAHGATQDGLLQLLENKWYGGLWPAATSSTRHEDLRASGGGRSSGGEEHSEMGAASFLGPYVQLSAPSWATPSASDVQQAGPASCTVTHVAQDVLPSAAVQLSVPSSVSCTASAVGSWAACGHGIEQQIGFDGPRHLRHGSRSDSLSSMWRQFGMESCSSLGPLAQSQENTSEALAAEDVQAATATAKVVSVARRAQELLALQADIEKEVASRWASGPAGSCWAGNFVQSVQIDTYGTFSFVVLKLSDAQRRQQFIVRGSNFQTELQMMERVKQEVQQARRIHDVLAANVEIVGVGRMTWQGDTDRHLYISPVVSHLYPSATARDMVSLAASLVQQSLPCHYHVKLVKA